MTRLVPALNTMAYDGDGKRRSYKDPAGLRRLLWDGENVVRQTDSGGTTNRRYTIKPAGFGELISQDDSFHHGVYPERSRGDALGNTDRITNASQVEQVAYRYRAFGEQTVVSGSSPNRFTWVGRQGYYRQPDLGNYRLRARVYEDNIARFLSRAPAHDEVNLYRYVANRPLVMVDPAGLQACRTPSDPCWHHRRRPGEYAAAGAMGPGGPGAGPGGPGVGMGRFGMRSGLGGTIRVPGGRRPARRYGGYPGGPGTGARRAAGRGGMGRGGGTGGIPLRTRVPCDAGGGMCCEVHPPGPGWWSNPMGIPHENWEVATCPCDEAPRNCTVVFHKAVYVRGPSNPVHKITARRGRCVWCGEVIPGWPEYPDGPGIILTDGRPKPEPVKNICGPDVTDKLQSVLSHRVWGEFAALGDRKDRICRQLFPFSGGVTLLEGLIRGSGWDVVGLALGIAFVGWDITPLNEFDKWFSRYRSGTYGCLQGDRCQGTVWVAGACYKAWMVNYVLYGAAGAICRIGLWEVKKRVSLWKQVAAVVGWGQLGYRLEDAAAAAAWAEFGWYGLPLRPDAPLPRRYRSWCDPCNVSYTGRMPGNLWGFSW